MFRVLLQNLWVYDIRMRVIIYDAMNRYLDTGTTVDSTDRSQFFLVVFGGCCMWRPFPDRRSNRKSKASIYAADITHDSDAVAAVPK